MARFSFKSAGKTRTDVVAETPAKPTQYVGIKTPVRPGNDDGLFEMTTTLADQVHDNLRNLLLTNWGERLGNYNFGANLRPLVTELVGTDSFDTQVIERISSAVNTWMPYVDLEDFASNADHIENKNTAVIRVTLTYNIPALDVKKRGLQVILYAI